MNGLRLIPCLLILALTAPVQAKPAPDFQLELEALQRASEAQSKNLATALNQIQEVLGEFQKLNGLVDQNGHLGSRLEKLIQDNQRRLEVLENKQQILVTQLEELKTAGLLPAETTTKLKTLNEYQKSLGQINREDYPSALKSLDTFLKNYPKSSLSASAHYWIGESHFAMRDFPAAVTNFQKLIKLYPNSDKVPAGLLKQGLSFYEMQSFDEAKAFLGKLVAKYPNTVEAEAALDKIKSIDELLEQRKLEQLRGSST